MLRPRLVTRANSTSDTRQSRNTTVLEASIAAGDARITGTLSMPHAARGVVAFAHGSGSGRFSPRNRFVAAALEDAGFATLLVDLLTADEQAIDSRTQEFRFDVALLAARTVAVVDWLECERHAARLPLGLFGASTGAAAALIAAAWRPQRVKAVVSRGGRPDLAADALPQVSAATLLIVGSEDHAVLELNEAAAARLRCPHRIAIVEGATHLFEERGTLERAAELTVDFFHHHLLTYDE